MLAFDRNYIKMDNSDYMLALEVPQWLGYFLAGCTLFVSVVAVCVNGCF